MVTLIIILLIEPYGIEIFVRQKYTKKRPPTLFYKLFNVSLRTPKKIFWIPYSIQDEYDIGWKASKKAQTLTSEMIK